MSETYIRNIKTIINDASNVEKASSSSSSVSININIKQNHIDILQSFESAGFSICTDILSDSNSISVQNLRTDSDVILNFSPHYMRTEAQLNFYFTLDDFLENNSIKIPEKFFILENSLTDASDSKVLDTYKTIVSFQNLFKDIADNVEQELKKNNIYTFFDTKKIKIHSSFKKEDIDFILEHCKNFGINIKKLYDDLEFENQKQIRIIFFKKALELTFKKTDISMSDILQNIHSIMQEYEAHYRAYINSLEPEKIKAEFEEEHYKVLKELNSILSDVHNKIIFIPIAFIFGAAQLTSGSYLKANMIIVGMLIFSLFISLFLDTHSKVLKMLNSDIKEKKVLYEIENPSLFKKFENKILALEDLHDSISIRMAIVKYSNWILTLVGTVIFYFLFK